MTGKEYQELAIRTCSIPYDQKEDRLFHAVFGLNSEAGEVAGILQKKYQGHEVNLEHMEKELGDCLWMIAEACNALGTDIDTVMQMNIDKLKARYLLLHCESHWQTRSVQKNRTCFTGDRFLSLQKP